MKDILEKVKAYTKKILNGEVNCTSDICLECGDQPEAFKLHERRRRIFFVIVERLVEKIYSYLPRWKCPLCGTTFTLYPDFAIPHKRYVREVVLDRCSRYSEDDQATYRKAANDHVGDAKIVKGEGMPVFHENNEGIPKPKNMETEGASCAIFAHSTIHRWITTLAGLKETVRLALEMIKTKPEASTSGFFRKVYPVPARKYRSEGCKEALQKCRKLVAVERQYQAFFGVSLFPNLATGCAWQ